MEAGLLGDDVSTGREVRLGREERRRGLYVIGRAGFGKTTLLLNLIVHDMQAGDGLCLLDPHGDLSDQVLACVPEWRRGDVILLDPLDSAFPFGLNLFDCADPADPEQNARSASGVMHVFEKLWGPTSATPSWGPQMADLLRNVILTIIANPGFTMAEVPLLLEEPTFRARLVANVSNRQVRRFWERTYDTLPLREQLSYRLSTLNKVREFLSQPIVENIIGQSKSSVNFREVMDRGLILIVRLPTGRLGDAVTSLLGSVIAGQLLAAALSRQDTPEEQRRLFYLYADEYQRFATPDFAVLLAEARKFAVATTIAHQFRSQLDTANRGASLNVANKVVFAVSGPDAEDLAREFDSTPPPGDVVGQKPVLVLDEQPVRNILAHGHRDPRVTDFFRYYLNDIHRISALSPDDTDLIPQHLSEALNRINTFFLMVMIEGASRRSHESQHHLRNYDSWYYHSIGIVTYLLRYLAIWSARPPSRPTRGEQWDILRRATAKSGRPDSSEGPSNRDEELWAFTDYFFPRPDHHDGVAGDRANLASFLKRLYEAADALEQDPVMTESGEYEPIYDRPRTYADVQNEIATMLTNLDPYHARCKILQGTTVAEFTVHTRPAPDCAEHASSEGRMGPIRERSRARYTRPRADVEQEILRRQDVRDPPTTTRRANL